MIRLTRQLCHNEGAFRGIGVFYYLLQPECSCGQKFDQAIAWLGPAGPTVQAPLGPGCTCRLPQLHGMLFQTCFSQLVALLLHFEIATLRFYIRSWMPRNCPAGPTRKKKLKTKRKNLRKCEHGRHRIIIRCCDAPSRMNPDTHVRGWTEEPFSSSIYIRERPQHSMWSPPCSYLSVGASSSDHTRQVHWTATRLSHIHSLITPPTMHHQFIMQDRIINCKRHFLLYHLYIPHPYAAKALAPPDQTKHAKVKGQR